MNILLINGSPRKNMNTATLLEKAAKGARSAGADVELVHLYDYEYSGCKSCFACKIKNSAPTGSVPSGTDCAHCLKNACRLMPSFLDRQSIMTTFPA